MRESCCSLAVRITPLFGKCLALPKETQNFIVVCCVIQVLRYDGLTELCGTHFHLLRIPSCCSSCDEYHDGSSCSVSFLLFVLLTPGCYLRLLVLDFATLDAAEMPTNGGYRPIGPDEVLTNPTKAAHGRVPVLRPC